MSAESAAILVARFLRSNNYHETLDAFLDEAGLQPDAGSSAKGVLTLEQLIHEKNIFDITRAFEKTGVEEEDTGWRLPAPTNPTLVDSLSANANLLHVSADLLTTSEDLQSKRCAIVASTADKQISFLKTHAPFERLSTYTEPSDSPILSCTMLFDRCLLTSSMSGKVVLHDLVDGKILDERRDHAKYVVKLVAKEKTNDDAWVATAAWDAKVFVYHVKRSEEGTLRLDAPVAEIKLPSNPESILFVDHPEISSPVLLISRRDSTFLYYYTSPGDHAPTGDNEPTPLIYLGRQNLAPHSNAWVAFTPSALAISPKDPLLLAVATSAVPHMKLIIVRLMLPPPPLPGSTLPVQPEHLTQASQARAELAQQDREDAAILIHCTTLAQQTAYSTPALAWRPDASGVYVNGDDGVVRGLETATGKIKATLKDGHEAGSKIRCLWAGMVNDREIIISGGFDRRLIVWEMGKVTKS